MRLHPHRAAFTAALLAIATTATFSTSALAGPHGRNPLRALEQRALDLDLDPDTRTAVEALFDEARPAQRALREDMRGAREALRALLAQENPDEGTLMSQAEQLGALSVARHQQALKTLLAVRALVPVELHAALTPAPGAERHERHGRGDCRGRDH